jgi:hypothetical protein
VNKAQNIEAAIDTATADNTRLGIVTLEDNKGKFEYTGDVAREGDEMRRNIFTHLFPV